MVRNIEMSEEDFIKRLERLEEQVAANKVSIANLNAIINELRSDVVEEEDEVEELNPDELQQENNVDEPYEPEN